ncbi:hypothetical protein VitviT2T_024541 [Vitis vinifera]|uniref:Exportin-2 central domain-containing protein n=1 Tax=Vitis vinifera TaxID=29760 RepID=A0ABY9DFW4_VITVI|nr:hypothetical protein VitviT2T_024541 [Vitis vinifera]
MIESQAADRSIMVSNGNPTMLSNGGSNQVSNYGNGKANLFKADDKDIQSRDCRHGGVLKIFALGSSAGFLSGSYQSGTLSAAYDAGFGAADNVISQIRQGIVIQNVQLKDEDEELFKMNHVEFVRNDTEGSDLDMRRRRIVCELLKGIVMNYKERVTAIVSVLIQNMLGSFATNPAVNWKDKDCAIFLVVSLATKEVGGNSVLTNLANVESFFGSIIVLRVEESECEWVPDAQDQLHRLDGSD